MIKKMEEKREKAFAYSRNVEELTAKYEALSKEFERRSQVLKLILDERSKASPLSKTPSHTTAKR